LPLRLTHRQWGKILRWFLLGLPSARIAAQPGLERRRLLRALLRVRRAMARDIPPSFSGRIEVDETYLGGQWKNKRRVVRVRGTKRGRGTSKTPVFGILCRGGQVWAQVVQDVEARTLLPLIRRRVARGSTIFSDTWKS
jgi:transposase